MYESTMHRFFRKSGILRAGTASVLAFAQTLPVWACDCVSTSYSDNVTCLRSGRPASQGSSSGWLKS